MKKLKAIACIILAASFFLFFGCSKHQLYHEVLNSARKSAGFTVKKTDIPIGEIVYSDNATEENPREKQDVIVMIHGFGGNKDNWLLLAEEIDRDYRVIALDLPGHGDSVSDTSLSYTIESQAKYLNDFLEAVGVNKAHIIGNSMGGAISVVFTHHYPEKVLSLALLDSAGVNKTKSEYFLLLEKGVNPLIVSNPEEYDRFLDFVMEKKPYIPGPVNSVMAEQKIARKAMDEQIFQDIMKESAGVENLLSGIHTSTLILWGDKDRALHVDNAKEFHLKIRGSRKILLNGVGHVPMIEAPKQTWKYYSGFLSSIH